MDHDDLTASHWDDVLPSNTPPSFSNLQRSFFDAPVNNEFSDLTINDPYKQHDDASEEEEEPNRDQHDYGGFLGFESSHYNSSAANQAELDQMSELRKEERNEHKHELLSKLTIGAEDESIIEPVASPVRVSASESLFHDNGSPIRLDKTRESTDELSSPKRSVQLKNGKFRAPKQRKFSSKVVTKHLNNAQDQGSEPAGDAALGPLGNGSESTSSDISANRTANRADLLVQETNAPLYNIANVSEEERLKKLRTHVPKVPETPETVPKVTPKNLPPSKVNKLDITVGDPMKVGDITNAHIVYSIRTRNKNLESNHFPKDQEEVTTSRRYKDFRWIYHQLQNNHPGRVVPPPPAKQTYIGRFNESFVENRRLSLEKMLTKISHIPVLANDPDFVMFLISEDFSTESKERERLSGLGASHQNSDALDNDNDDSNSFSSSSSAPVTGIGSVGFMSSLFSMSSKVEEPDEFFSEKKAYIDDLEANLKNFHKSIELICAQRLEMIGIMDEISTTVDELASLEILKVTTELLNAFSEVHLKLKENLDRINLQDQLTLGFTIEEYLRIIGSVKFTFETRVKIYQQYYNSNQELIKKEAQLNKVNRKLRTNPVSEKANVLTFEVDKLKAKTTVYEKQFNSISEVIKDEIQNFEFEKIDEFRNSVEIFIESSIESQKEAIELWETFYEHQNLAKV